MAARPPHLEQVVLPAVRHERRVHALVQLSRQAGLELSAEALADLLPPLRRGHALLQRDPDALDVDVGHDDAQGRFDGGVDALDELADDLACAAALHLAVGSWSRCDGHAGRARPQGPQLRGRGRCAAVKFKGGVLRRGCAMQTRRMTRAGSLAQGRRSGGRGCAKQAPCVTGDRVTQSEAVELATGERGAPSCDSDRMGML